jgi:hypothetical protein
MTTTTAPSGGAMRIGTIRRLPQVGGRRPSSLSPTAEQRPPPAFAAFVVMVRVSPSPSPPPPPLLSSLSLPSSLHPFHVVSYPPSGLPLSLLLFFLWSRPPRMSFSASVVRLDVQCPNGARRERESEAGPVFWPARIVLPCPRHPPRAGVGVGGGLLLPPLLPDPPPSPPGHWRDDDRRTTMTLATVAAKKVGPVRYGRRRR